jgi:hypothetical protein
MSIDAVTDARDDGHLAGPVRSVRHSDDRPRSGHNRCADISTLSGIRTLPISLSEMRIEIEISD